MDGSFDIRCEDRGILMATYYGDAYVAGESAARVYYELFDGVQVAGQEIRGLFLRIATGGQKAESWYDYWRYSVYGRTSLRAVGTQKLLRRAWVRRYGPFNEYGYPEGMWPLWDWRSVYIPIAKTDHIRCIVVKLECMQNHSTSGGVQGWDENGSYGGSAPFAVVIKAATIYASDLLRNITAPRVLKHIASTEYPDATSASDATQYDQLAFTEIPADRWDAIDDVVAMNGWSYHVWDGDKLSFVNPDSAAKLSVPKDHAGVSYEHGPDESEAFNAVRVQYTNKNGRTREVILHGKLKLGGDVVADTVIAPDSVKSKAGALRVARRWLKARGKVPNVGDINVTGTGPWGDALKLRPGVDIGKSRITHVTLNPLEWKATLQFGVNVDSYEAWLARLAAGAKAKKR